MDEYPILEVGLPKFSENSAGKPKVAKDQLGSINRFV